MLYPEARIDTHVDARCQALAQSLETRKAIYLDFRFWVTVREVWEGIRVRAEDRKLVHHLTRLVRAGRIFCPITAATFSELMKVRQRERREATIRAIDQLSVGVALRPEQERVEAEVEDLVLGCLTPKRSGRSCRVWTRLPYVLGNTQVGNTGFPPETEQAIIQKAFFDHLWELPLSAIAAKLDPEMYDMQAEMTALAERLNEDNRAHRVRMKSFEIVLCDELSGAAELAQQALHRVIARAHRAATGRADAPEVASDQTGLNLLRACLLSEHGHRLPTLHVHAGLHALFRWEYRDKLLTANDMFDLAHAAAALAHCDAFFTERELAGSVAHRRLGFDKHHRCFVTCRTAEAVDYLRSFV
jgi:hypothetical protein